MNRKVKFRITYMSAKTGHNMWVRKRWKVTANYGACGVQVSFVKKPTRKQLGDILKWLKQAACGDSYTPN